MKKIFSLLMVAALALGISSCECSKEESKEIVKSVIEWNVSATAEGEGHVKVSYPSGALTVNGDGLVNVYSASDTLFRSAVPAVTLFGAPANYTEEEVAFATSAQRELESAFNVDVLEGAWSVDLTFYARQPQTGLVFVFTKHWPEEKTAAAE